MATPTLRAIRDHFGRSASITGILRPYVAEVLEGTTWLSDFIEFNPKAKDRKSRRNTLALIRDLRQRQFETAVILPNSPRPAIASLLAGIPQRIGYVRYGRGPLLTERLMPPRNGWRFKPVSAVDYYLKIAEALGADTSDRRLELKSHPRHDAAAKEVWDTFGLHGKRVIVFNTGGAYGAAKSWPTEHFAGLAHRLTRLPNTHVVIVCGPAERATADQIAALSDRRNVHSLGSFPASIGFTKAVIRKSNLLISTDSGPRFFGTAFGVPTISLFGPTDPTWSQTFHPLEVNLNIDVDCGPCARRVCPLSHHRCMTDLSVDHVYENAFRLLETTHRDVA